MTIVNEYRFCLYCLNDLYNQTFSPVRFITQLDHVQGRVYHHRIRAAAGHLGDGWGNVRFSIWETEICSMSIVSITPYQNNYHIYKGHSRSLYRSAKHIFYISYKLNYYICVLCVTGLNINFINNKFSSIVESSKQL